MSKKLTTKTFFTNFKRLLSYFTPYHKEITALSILGVISAIGNGSIPFITGHFFDSLITPTFIWQWPAYFVWLIIWLIIQGTTAMIDWRNNSNIRNLSEEIERDFIVKSFVKLLYLPISFHHQKKIGAVTSQITRAANN